MRAIIATCAALVLAGPAAASQAEVNRLLRETPRIYNGLFAIAVADELRKNCGAIEPRLLRAWRLLGDLRAAARELGVSEAQAKAFVDDKQEQAVMRTYVERYLDEHGVQDGDPESYCTQGRREIAAGTQAGVLLRAR